MLKGIINGKINRGTFVISFSTSVLKSVINVLVIVSSCCHLSEHNMERHSCQLSDTRFVTLYPLQFALFWVIISIDNLSKGYAQQLCA